MTLSRFYKLRQMLHFVDNTISLSEINNEDVFWKVRPIFDAVLSRCKQLELEGLLSVDEQMVPFKGKHVEKQYIHNKPTKWGIKIFALCGVSGLIYDFIIYQGKKKKKQN